VFVLRDVSFDIWLGSIVVVVGVIGFGKSILMTLFVCFVDFGCGEVLFDGVSLRDFVEGVVVLSVVLVF